MQKEATKDGRGRRRPALKADCAGPLEELFRKEKTKESGRICKRLCKGFDEVVQHAGSPFGDGGLNRFAQSAFIVGLGVKRTRYKKQCNHIPKKDRKRNPKVKETS